MKRGEKGRYTREENVDKTCNVILENGEEKEMSKGQMYDLIKDDEEKKIIFQNGLYFVVHKAIYQAIKQPEWREAKQKKAVIRGVWRKWKQSPKEKNK